MNAREAMETILLLRQAEKNIRRSHAEEALGFGNGAVVKFPARTDRTYYVVDVLLSGVDADGLGVYSVECFSIDPTSGWRTPGLPLDHTVSCRASELQVIYKDIKDSPWVDASPPPFRSGREIEV